MSTNTKEPTPEWAKELYEEHCTRENVMKLCRYFRGETTPPYPENENEDWRNVLFWACEKLFVDYMLDTPSDAEISNLAEACTDAARQSGMYKEINGIFAVLAAILWSQYCNGKRDTEQEFSNWLKRYYIGQAPPARHTNLLQYTKFYKDETEPPHNTDDNTSFFQGYEKAWIDFHATCEGIFLLNEYIHVYDYAELTNFSLHDGTPLSLKALLFNRYCHWSSGTMLDCARGFKKFYSTEYLS